MQAEEDALRAYLRDALQKSGLTKAEVQKRIGTQIAGHYFGRSQWEFPTREAYAKMQAFMPLETGYDDISGLFRIRKSLQSLQSLQRLQRLQSLQSLQRLKPIEKIKQTALSYDALQIPDDAVIYADIPYEGTACNAYEGFDHQKFYDWAARQRVPVFVSSYQISDERFVCVWERSKSCTLQGGGSPRTERIYTQKRSIA